MNTASPKVGEVRRGKPRRSPNAFNPRIKDSKAVWELRESNDAQKQKRSHRLENLAIAFYPIKEF